MLKLAGKRLAETVAKSRAWAYKNPWRFFMLAAALVAFLWVLFQTIRADNTELKPKTFWDWLGLLIVPVALVIGVWWLGRGERKAEQEAVEKRARTEREMAEERARTEREIALARQHQATLEAYFDRMTELLERGLGGSDGNRKGGDPEGREGGRVVSIARARTLAVLRTLDSARVSAVFRFLRETRIDDKSLADLIPLHDTDLHGVKWHGPEADLKRISLRGANLYGADLHGANLTDVNLHGANLLNADLSMAHLHRVDLGEAYLRGAYLGMANMREANLSRADLAGANLGAAHLSVANLSEANLHSANLGTADLSAANLRGADLRGTILSGSYLQLADLRGANLSDAELSWADLRGADLRGVNLHKTILRETNLKEAAYDRETTWPDGFDPEAAGARFDEEGETLPFRPVARPRRRSSGSE